MEPRERRKRLHQLGQQIHKQQQQRISAQQNPDGTAFAPRKGRIKRKMFTKLKQSKWMKMEVTDEAVSVGYSGRVGHIARIHQYGLTDKPAPKSRSIRYKQRKLLGIQNASMIFENILNE